MTILFGILQILTVAGIIVVLYRPLGDYMARIFTSKSDLAVERGFYRLIGVDSRSEQAGSDGQRSTSQLTIRVPADSVDDTIEKLKEFGSVDSVSLSSNDVTLQELTLETFFPADEDTAAVLRQLHG